MTANDVRSRLEKTWQEIDREAEARKDSQSAVFALESFYRGLKDEELGAAHDVLVTWAQSNNAKKRFDALALIDKFLIVEALPVLRRLAEEFENSDEPSAPYEWAKVNRIIGRLATHPSPGLTE